MSNERRLLTREFKLAALALRPRTTPARVGYQGPAHQPTETGWCIPPQPTRRRSPQPHTKPARQMEDVPGDRRGNIYVDDRGAVDRVLHGAGPAEADMEEMGIFLGV